MYKKRITSLVLIIAMIVTMFVVPVTYASAEQAEIAQTASGNDTAYNLSSDVQNGNILHAFNWKLSEVTQYAEEIAAAGYSAVQISPIQKTKDTTNDGSYATDWWSFYQPTDLKIGNALGDADDLSEMCATLHSYGIKVICDVVTNHVQNCEDKADAGNISATLKGFLRRGTGTTVTSYIDNTRVGQTQTDLNSQLPDLNTSNKSYQNYVVSYLKSLLDCGADGFRFDAAKHIETPDDGSCASDFWPTVVNAVKGYKSNAYIYGEILASNGKFNISSYTKYINVTDYAYGNTVRSAVKGGSSSSLTNYGYTGSSKSNNVLWVESHDNFCDYSSTSLTKKQQILGWAVTGSRKDAPALYFVRPNCESLDSAGFIKYDELMGAPGAAVTWKDPTVAAINKFKNEFVGQNETDYSDSNMFYVQRGTKGMVIVNLKGTSASVNRSCSMANGTYKDQVSGNTFTVSNGNISGNVGSSGVAVVYNPQNATPIATVKLNSTTLTVDSLNRYTDATANITISLKNATSGTVKVSNLAEKAVPSSGLTFTLNSSIAYGKSVDITVSATNGSQTTTETYKVYKKNMNESKRVYFDNAATGWTNIYVFCKTGEAASTKISAFPGYKMSLVSGSSTLYYYDVPSNANYVKFGEGPVTAHLGHTASQCGGYCGRTLPQTVIPYGTAVNAANREAGGYKLDGSMICQKLVWKDYGEYPVASLSSSDVSFDGTQPTVPPTTPLPTAPVGNNVRGDANKDENVDILDATHIQRYLAKLTTITNDMLICSDVDGDSNVTILDATNIQLYLAKISNQYNIGGIISGTPLIPTTPPTDPPTEPETDPESTSTIVTLNKPACFVGAEVYLYAYNTAGGQNAAWPGVKMENNGSTYTLEVDNALSSFQFVGYYGDVKSSVDGNTYANTIQTADYTLSDTPFTLETVTLTSNKTWSNCLVHMWGGTGDSAVGTQWPGIKMSGSSGNYSIVIPKNSRYEKYMVDDGGSNQAGPWDVPTSSVNPTSPLTPTSPPSGGTNVLYFDASKISNDAPRFAAFFFQTGMTDTWADMTLVGNNVYSVTVPDGYTNVIFCRMNGKAPENSWTNKWNQTDDLTITSANNLYTVSAYVPNSDKLTGSWGTR